MNPQVYVPEPIREEIELARALTALIMAVKIDCAERQERTNSNAPITRQPVPRSDQ